MKQSILAALIALTPFGAVAQEVVIGEEVPARVTFCPTIEAAEQVVKTHKEEGFAAAVVIASINCITHDVLVTPERVVSVWEVEKGKTMRVVQIKVRMADESLTTHFMLVSIPVRSVKGAKDV